MLKFLFYTDLHFKTINPVHRVGSYAEDIYKKFVEIYEIARSEKVDAILFGGDFFDTYKLFDVEYFRKLKEVVAKAHAPTYAAIGQHNLLGYNLESYLGSTLSLFEDYCGDLWQTLNEPKAIGDCVLEASHCTGDFDGLKKILKKGANSKYRVVLAHCLLYDKTDKLIGTKDVKDFENDTTDVVLSGDLHCGYPICKVGRTIFANPGAVCRKELNDNRQVQVALVHVGERIGVEYVPLRSAKPYEDVFEQTRLETVKKTLELEQVDEAAAEFAKKISEIEMNCEDVFSLLEVAANLKNIPQEVREYVKSFREKIKLS